MIIQKQAKSPGRNYPCDVRVRLTEEQRTGLVLIKEKQGLSFSEIVRQALTETFMEYIEIPDRSYGVNHESKQ